MGCCCWCELSEYVNVASPVGCILSLFTRVHFRCTHGVLPTLTLLIYLTQVWSQYGNWFDLFIAILLPWLERVTGHILFY